MYYKIEKRNSIPKEENKTVSINILIFRNNKSQEDEKSREETPKRFIKDFEREVKLNLDEESEFQSRSIQGE